MVTGCGNQSTGNTHGLDSSQGGSRDRYAPAYTPDDDTDYDQRQIHTNDPDFKQHVTDVDVPGRIPPKTNEELWYDLYPIHGTVFFATLR